MVLYCLILILCVGGKHIGMRTEASLSSSEDSPKADKQTDRLMELHDSQITFKPAGKMEPLFQTIKSQMSHILIGNMENGGKKFQEVETSRI